MALTVGELQVILSGDNRQLNRDIDQIDRRADLTEQHYKSAFSRAGAEGGRSLIQGMQAAEKEAPRSGERAGGKLSQGISQGLIRNSPMIAAAIAGAMAAGAPVALAGATFLFAGVAAIALSQNEEVAASYRDLWATVRDTAISDSAVLAPAFIQAADQIETRYQKLRPAFRDAFEAAGPQVNTLTAGILDLATNAMPGLVGAVQRGEPVMEGFRSLLADTGTGLAGFFDGMSEHAPAAGRAFASIGDILQTLLPTLGNLLGTGAEIASVVLPPLASALHAVEGPLESIAPVLPLVVAGFLGLKAAQGVAGIVNGIAGGLSNFATQGAAGVQVGGRLGGAMSGTARALSGVGTALPIIGLGVAALSANMAQQEQLARDNTTAFTGLFQQLREGGAAAQQGAAGIAMARQEISEWGDRGQWGAEIAGQLRDGMESGAEAARHQAEATDVLVAAQQTAEAAQSSLNSAIDMYGAGSPEVAAAAADLANANSAVAEKAAAAEQATYGLTSAISAQLQQALVAANADLAYRDAVDQVQTAQEALTTAVRDHGAASEEADDAGRQLEASMLAQVDAAGRLATEALPATTDEMTRSTVAAQAQLAELESLRTQMGGTLPPALEAARASLAATTAGIDQSRVAATITTGEMQNLGLSVTQIPGSKFVRVEAPTAEQKQRLQDLGYVTRTLPDGDILVLADTSQAESALRSITAPRSMTVVANVVAGLNPFGGAGKLGGAIGGIVRQYADGGFQPMQGGIAQVVGPNTWRVIGDRVKDDEAYIPINSDRRSRDILGITASRMGYELVESSNVAAGNAATPVAGAFGTVTGSSKNYYLTANTREELSLKRFMALVQEYEALYG